MHLATYFISFRFELLVLSGFWLLLVLSSFLLQIVRMLMVVNVSFSISQKLYAFIAILFN